ncbi:MAG TPA: hypothetical protein PK536_13990 [Ignavibacteria bacterium]|nr:hypothetical protein [Bacteroidota bacterium]HRI86550.1 hypothetical protein [Ignavibacteria bacterium]HRK00367.1 hypothetical protein [Ignavibacteria bacterium]
MNKYFVKIPYSYTQYANLSGFVYAESEEEAEELACDTFNLYEDSHDDTDSSDDSDYAYDDMKVSLEESDINTQDIPQRNTASHFKPAEPNLPDYFLEDLPELSAL